MGKIKTADYLIKQLNNLGITEIFGLPGDFNFKIVEAVERNKNVNWVGSSNELNGGYCADGYARIKGYGAIITTYGVGELSAINALAGAMAENVPVMHIAGVPALKHIRNKSLLHHNLPEADYKVFERIYSNIVEDYDYLDENNIKEKIDRLINVMINTKKPVYLAIPDDVCEIEIEDNFTVQKEKSDTKNLEKAVDEIIKLIDNSKKPFVLADIITSRYEAKEEFNAFLKKTEIPSCAFVRGIDIIDNEQKNYLGVYTGKIANYTCYNYLNSSDCIIASGTVLSDLNTFGFDYKFNLKNHINIQYNYCEIKGKRYDNILIKDVFKKLNEKIKYKSKENLEREFYYKGSLIQDDAPLTSEYIYPQIANFLKKDDILLTEVGLTPYGMIPAKMPENISVQNQILWGSIGWATPCAFGCAIADRKRRTILLTGDGAHQLSAQEVSTMLRNKVKPIIFVINNSGYTVERILCDNVDYKYNDIAIWNYQKLPLAFKGDCFIASAKTNREFDEVLKAVEVEQKERMCYIELFTDYLDLPYLAKVLSKHPEQLK